MNDCIHSRLILSAKSENFLICDSLWSLSCLFSVCFVFCVLSD